MPIGAKSITPCLWFDTQAEAAANFCCSVFKNSRITAISRCGAERDPEDDDGHRSRKIRAGDECVHENEKVDLATIERAYAGHAA